MVSIVIILKSNNDLVLEVSTFHPICDEIQPLVPLSKFIY
jgi:hypothetical protein